MQITEYPNNVDDTDTFRRAIDAALAEGPTFENEKLQCEQHVVKVPPARWRVHDVLYPDYLRIAGDAGLYFQLPAGAGWDSDKQAWGRASMFLWGAEGNSPVQIKGASLVAEGHDWNSPKRRFWMSDAIFTDLHPENALTMVVDPETSQATNVAIAVDLCNVDGYELENIISVQNATNQAPPVGQSDAHPTSSVASFTFRAAAKSPIGVDPALFMQPKNGFADKMFCVDAPRGYGWNQINAADGLQIGTVATLGGTGLRLETDGSLENKNTGGVNRGAIVRGLVAQDVRGAYCNRGASVTPHGQDNADVWIKSIRTSRAFQALVLSKSNKQGGRFKRLQVDAIDALGGFGAQTAPSDPSRTWDVVNSECVISIDPIDWLANCFLPVPTHRGAFTKAKLY